MNFRQLESFLAIAELNSFAAAADRLCVTQSTISARIHELEQVLGVELFDRTQRTARLTLKGRELINYAAQIMSLSSEIRLRIGAKDALTGVVRIGVAELVAISWLPDLVNAVRHEYPNIKLEFEVGLNPSLIEGIRNGRLDLVILAGKFQEPGFDAFDLGRVRFSWMSSPTMFPGQEKIKLEELRKLPILYQGKNSFTNGIMEQILGISSVRERTGMTCNSLDALFALTQASVGIGFLPVSHYSDAIRNGKLKIIQTEPKYFLMPFSISCASNSPELFTDIARLCVQSSKFDKLIEEAEPSTHIPQANIL